MEYRVHARRIDAHGSLAVAKEAEVTLDTDLAGRRDAMNPVELLLAVGADIGSARLDGMTAIHTAQLPGTPKAIYELIMLGQEEL